LHKSDSLKKINMTSLYTEENETCPLKTQLSKTKMNFKFHFLQMLKLFSQQNIFLQVSIECKTNVPFITGKKLFILK
jgi:hypothetical protein